MTLQERINVLRSHGLPPQAVAAVLNISQADVRSLELDPEASVTDPFDAIGGIVGGSGGGADPAWGAGGALYETMRRLDATGWGAPSSGVMHCTGGVSLEPGQPVSGVTLLSQNAIANPSHQWVAIIRKADRSVLAKSADLEDAAWAAHTEQSFAFEELEADPTFSVPVYVGVVIVADTVPNIYGLALPDDVTALDPPLAGVSDTGLTDPASLGATAAVIAGDPDFAAWARLT